MTLVKLNPGLQCKNCKTRMTMGRDVPGVANIVLVQGTPVSKMDFEVLITCDVCASIHSGKCFVRDGVFIGCYEYNRIG